MTDGHDDSSPGDGDLVPVGDGPVCTVLAGVDATTGTAYALRVLPGDPGGESRERFAEESGRLAGLRGTAPVIVPDGLVRLDDGRWAVRRELAAQSLPELIAFSGPLPVVDAVAVGVSLAEALAAVHGVGVVHGGVTPGNVLFRASGEPVLADPGLSLRRPFPPATGAPPATDAPAASGALAAPETGRYGRLDERSDLYGLGVVLHVAVTGAPPREPGDRPGPPVPPELADLISALLAELPDRRPPDATTVAAALRRPPPTDEHRPSGEPTRLPGEPPLSVDGPPVPSGRPVLEFGPARRRWLPHRAAPVGVGALTLLAVIGAVTLPQQSDDTEATPIRPASTPEAAPPNAEPPRTEQTTRSLRLAEPTDRGGTVELSWTGGAGTFYYFVRVAGEGRQPQVVPAQRRTSLRVAVVPGLRYCFTVRGTDGESVVDSATRPIRGADCP